jgi:hypothetical protein
MRASSSRLREVVVGAHFQPDDAIGLLAARGEQDDRHARAGAQVAAQLEAVVPGQHQVEDHQVGPRALQRRAQASPVRYGGYPVALLLEIVAQQRADFRIVVNDEDVVGHEASRNRKMAAGSTSAAHGESYTRALLRFL